MSHPKPFCGYCTPAGVPVACDLVPGGLHDLAPVHELICALPRDASVYTASE